MRIEPERLDGWMERSSDRKPGVPDHDLLRCIGRGAYGEVWLARNVVGTYRAVKVVYRDRFEESRPYEREYHGIRRFEPVSRSHHGLVDILQIGRNDEDGYFYYVMELADDTTTSTDSANPSPSDLDPARYIPLTLGRKRAGTGTGAGTETEIGAGTGALPAAECLGLGLMLCDALARLHEHGLIHRDIKPSNIIFSGGVPKLADIGLVTGLDESVSYVGTEGFIPPEGPNSAQADIYSLGKVLYEIVMGKDRLDFPEPSTELESAPDRALLLEFNAVLARACDADVRRRYATVNEMRGDLQAIQEGKSVRKRQLARRRLRHTAMAAAAAVTLTLLAVLAEAYLGWHVRVLQEQSHGIHPALRGKVMPRHPGTPPELIDLSAYYNASLIEAWYPGPNANTLAGLPQGVHTLAGVPFDLRGIVQLSGREIEGYGAVSYPARMNELILGRWVKRIHLLGGVLSEVSAGREVARTRVRAISGDSWEIPWIYGGNVRALWQAANLKSRFGDPIPAWTGSNPATRERELELHLYTITWDNPRPDEELVALDFLSTRSSSAPFLVAVTVEEHAPQGLSFDTSPGLITTLQQHSSSFPILPVGPYSDRNPFHSLTLNQPSVSIGDRFHSGFRFTLPTGVPVDLAWGFRQTPELSPLNWYIMPLEGTLKSGFEDWHHGFPRQREPADEPSALCLQFLDGRKLTPGAEYLIWFSFPHGNPLKLEAVLAFVPAGTPDPNQADSLVAALGLTGRLTVMPYDFHRHYCLGALR